MSNNLLTDDEETRRNVGHRNDFENIMIGTCEQQGNIKKMFTMKNNYP